MIAKEFSNTDIVKTSADAAEIAEFDVVNMMGDTLKLELTPAPIAWLLDKPGFVSYMVYEFPVQETPEHVFRNWNMTFDAGPRIAVLPCNEPLVLPMLTEDDAEEVAQHAFFSGASLMVTAQVCARRGKDAMYDYADTQNVYGMPGAPAIDEDELKWVGSDL